MDVSVIIVNYNTCNLTLQCLKSLYEKTEGIDFEVIVVDNASSDESLARIKKEYPQVILVESQENLGFGKANNLGYEKSSGKYVFLLNSDTLLIENVLFKLFHFLNCHSNISILGCQLVDSNFVHIHSYSLLLPSIVWEVDILLHGFIHTFLQKISNCRINNCGSLRVAHITGADMMLRRMDIEFLGLFDSDFFMYFEDTELSYRYAKNRRFSYYYPGASIVHLEGKSVGFAEKRERLYLHGRYLYYKKNFNLPYRLIVDGIYSLSCLTRIMIFILVFKKAKTKFWIMKFRFFLKTYKL